MSRRSSFAPSLESKFPIVKKLRMQPGTQNCTATCFHNALIALAEKTGRTEIRTVSIKEIGKTIRLKKDLILNTRYIVPAFNSHFKKKGLIAYQKHGPKTTLGDLETVLLKPNASPPIVTLPSNFFELYGIEVAPDPVIAGSDFAYSHDILVLGVDAKVWFYDPLANRPNLNRAHINPEGQVDLPRFLQLWQSTKEPNSLVWIETVPPGPIDKYLKVV